jgi:hypothetical protein
LSRTRESTLAKTRAGPDGRLKFRSAAALARGLKITPLKKTLNATLAWHLTLPAEEREKLKAGIAADKEATVLTVWKVQL